jgi:hypothetical protein
VLDSWGSFPSGIYSGNLYDFGSFDQCLKFEHDTNTTNLGVIEGQHCTLMIPFEHQHNKTDKDSQLRFIPQMEK